MVSDSMKGGDKKYRGRRMNAQQIQDVGGILVAFGQYSTINEDFDLLTKRIQ